MLKILERFIKKKCRCQYCVDVIYATIDRNFSHDVFRNCEGGKETNFKLNEKYIRRCGQLDPNLNDKI